ncbi:hypothetical protein [Clostridium sp.]|uniref:hypothetical protein n=1 Tax=Clostridium sp. TaxID=1506 RepID=UPI002623758E|nr:hypothetical protein [Clostridium sp.]
MFNEDNMLSDEELLEITGGGNFATNITVISNEPIMSMLYAIRPLYGIKPLYGIEPLNTIE